MRTQLLLDVFEIPHRTEVIDFRSGQNRESWYLDIHPYGRVPALKDGELTIIESGAITLHLADKYAEKMGTPAPGTPERARLYEWVLFFQATLEPVAAQSFGSEDKTESKAKVHELLTAMQPRLGSPYALGDKMTLLDIIIGCELTWYKLIGLYPDGLARYDELLQRLGPVMARSFGTPA